MNKLPVLSAKEFYAALLRYGCVTVTSEGSHFKVLNPQNGNRYLLPVHANKDVSRGVMKIALSSLGIDIDDFLAKM